MIINFHYFSLKRRILFCSLVIMLIFLPFNFLALEGQKSGDKFSPELLAAPLQLSFSTLFGGNLFDEGDDIAVARDGSFYLTGTTYSNNFPILNAFNKTLGGISDGFISKFTTTGELLWSTFLGGNESDGIIGIATASDSSCYVTGGTFSNNFPTKNAYNDSYNGECDAVVAKFSSEGALLWSTYLGGSDVDYGQGIAVASDGSCYVTGSTFSSNFPTKNAYQINKSGDEINPDIFVTKFTANGTLLWSTFLGGSDWDEGYSIVVGVDGSCFITGYTASSDFTTKFAYNSAYGYNDDGFISKFNTDGQLQWSTFLGGSSSDIGFDLAVADDGSCFVIGKTTSSNFPTKDAYNDTYGGGGDVFLSKFAHNGALMWSTFLGGRDWDFGTAVTVPNDDICLITGSTSSDNFPSKDCLASFCTSGINGFIACFSTDGKFLWNTFIRGTLDIFSLSITCSNQGYYITGCTEGQIGSLKNAYQQINKGSMDVFIIKYNVLQGKVPMEGFFSFLIVLPFMVVLKRKRK